MVDGILAQLIRVLKQNTSQLNCPAGVRSVETAGQGQVRPRAARDFPAAGSFTGYRPERDRRIAKFSRKADTKNDACAFRGDFDESIRVRGNEC